MNNKLPPELHLINGTKGVNQGTFLPDAIKKRIPKADWLDNPSLWDKDVFIQETADYLFKVYGLGTDQDKHTLAMLTDQIGIYVKCSQEILKVGLVIVTNNGKTAMPNPYVSIKQKTLRDIILLMNELGLTPRSRLNSGKVEDDSPIAKFLRGPKG